jgi:two-component system sensor histidine kinase DevS
MHQREGVGWPLVAVRDVADSSVPQLGDGEIRQLLDAMNEPVLIIDATSLRVSYVNQGAVDGFGYSRAELLGTTPMKLSPDYTEADLRAFVERLEPGESRTYTTMHRRRDGNEVPFEVACQLQAGTGASPDRLVLLLRDVRERLAAERRLREAERELRSLEERDRIAGDLHDTVLQRMFSADLGLQAVAGRIQDPIAAARVEAVIAQLDDTIRDLRAAIFGLRLVSSVPRTLRHEVAVVVAEATPALGFEPLVTWRGAPEDVDDDVAVQLVPTVREALSNVARHARASAVRVTIDVGDGVTLGVADNGVGIPAVTGGGNGLRNMRRRAERLGGSFAVDRGPDGGTTLTWRAGTAGALGGASMSRAHP